MRPRLLVAAVLTLGILGPGAAPGAEFELHVQRARLYGGTTAVATIAPARPGISYRWQTSVLGAVVERGTAEAAKDGSVDVEVRVPVVARVAPLVLQVEALHGDERVARHEAKLWVFPLYEPERLAKAAQGTALGIAAGEAGLFAWFDKAGVEYLRVSSRLAFDMGDCDVLIVSGKWLDKEGADMVPLIREKVRDGLRLVVLEPREDWSLFPFERRLQDVPATASCRVLRPDDSLTRGRRYLDEWVGMDIVPPRLTGKGNPCNVKLIAEEADTGLPLLAEVFPPGHGAIVFVGLPVLGGIEDDPAAPLLVEACLVLLGREELVPVWRPILSAGNKEETRRRLQTLGIAVAGLGPESGRAKAPLMVAAIGNPARRQVDHGTPGLPREILDWVYEGNDALILVRGCPSEEPVLINEDELTGGVSPLLLRSLRAGEDEAGSELPDFGLGGQSKVLISGLLTRTDLGGGRLYVLRDGPRETAEEGKDMIKGAWAEFISVILTNLGLRIESNLQEESEG